MKFKGNNVETLLDIPLARHGFLMEYLSELEIKSGGEVFISRAASGFLKSEYSENGLPRRDLAEPAFVLLETEEKILRISNLFFSFPD